MDKIYPSHFPQRNSVFIVAQEINMMRVFLWAKLEISAINKIAKKRSGAAADIEQGGIDKKPRRELPCRNHGIPLMQQASRTIGQRGMPACKLNHAGNNGKER
ncbi:jg8199 [Pararge aegeria aegeria]|uniref:Jg8199 protein n=1 Tax=Pararge aegeria aegeria TaxID=348720 RepID=A0A8S4SP83_9NEOP|nr:jg8199 [Pararge aegeria aegeria]